MGRHARSVLLYVARSRHRLKPNANDRLDRDPEAEAEEKVEEEKVPGVEEEGAVAIESGFPAGGADWEAAPAGFPAAATGEWSEAQPATWESGAAAATAPATEWADSAPKDTAGW